MNYWLIFLTGLTSGGISCALMQGGFLTSVVANGKSQELVSKQKSTNPSSFDAGDWGPVTAFLIAKLLAHIILGFLLGFLGSTLSMSLPVRLFFQVFVAVFMLATAANLFDLHPIFRYLSFTPPRFIRKLIKDTTKSGLLFAPAALGFLTIFIPCGVTQAMIVLSIGSGNPLTGAMTMGSFVAGTLPIFVFIGIATAKLSEIGKVYFLRTAAVLLVGMALYSINGVLTVIDSPFSFARIFLSRQSIPVSQTITIMVQNNGYTPNNFTVRVGTPVELILITKDVYTCAASFTFSAFNISTYLAPNSETKFSFTPLQRGRYTFSCSMGMYSGTMEVI